MLAGLAPSPSSWDSLFFSSHWCVSTVVPYRRLQAPGRRRHRDLACGYLAARCRLCLLKLHTTARRFTQQQLQSTDLGNGACACRHQQTAGGAHAAGLGHAGGELPGLQGAVPLRLLLLRHYTCTGSIAALRVIPRQEVRCPAHTGGVLRRERLVARPPCLAPWLLPPSRCR